MHARFIRGNIQPERCIDNSGSGVEGFGPGEAGIEVLVIPFSMVPKIAIDTFGGYNLLAVRVFLNFGHAATTRDRRTSVLP